MNTGFRIIISMVGLLFMWTFGSQIIGYFFKLLLLFAHKKLTWSPEKDKMSTLKSFSIHTQDGLFGPHWGFGFQHGGRRHFYFHDYMGWHNLSELHRRDKCDDHAYCPWHGSL